MSFYEQSVKEKRFFSSYRDSYRSLQPHAPFISSFTGMNPNIHTQKYSCATDAALIFVLLPRKVYLHPGSKTLLGNVGTIRPHTFSIIQFNQPVKLLYRKSFSVKRDIGFFVR